MGATRLGISILLLCLIVTVPGSRAEEDKVEYESQRTDCITFRVQSKAYYQVDLEFYSQDRNAAWPGGGKVFVLKDSAIHEFPLKCRPGEKICYGAWVRNATNQYWGVGYNDRQSCTQCCFTANGQVTPVLVLNE
ncbi:MAG: hypothetical protein HY814_05260 [Candidatus Riflebacteria bacterium]|nr:hypothetical protein [Candidatus Riflebacteria bacterium]